MSADLNPRDLRARLASAQSKGGLEGQDLWCSAWRAFRQARDGVSLAVGPEELGDVADELAGRFVRALQYATAEIEASGEVEGKSWTGTARGMAEIVYGAGVELTTPQLKTLEAAARHAANV